MVRPLDEYCFLPAILPLGEPRQRQMEVGAFTMTLIDRLSKLEALFDAVTLMQKHDEKFEGEIPLATIQKVYAAHTAILRAKEASNAE